MLSHNSAEFYATVSLSVVLYFLPRDATQSAVMTQCVVRPYVCPWRSGVIFTSEYFENNFISRLISLRFLLGLTPTWAIWSNPPKYGGIGVGSGPQKTCNVSETCKLHTRFRLVPKLMTLHDLERPKRHSCRNKKVLRSRSEKIERR